MKRLIEAAKKEGKVVYWDAGGSTKEWEQLFSKFRLKYPFLGFEHWTASDAEVYLRLWAASCKEKTINYLKSRVVKALQGLRVIVSSPELPAQGTDAEKIWRDIFLD